ncbi:MAG TPA: hypothetical protein VL463_07000 [Kofleriaceae bacterium]|nr:hypothetical protein [Kofleriaceae bacterium]
MEKRIAVVGAGIAIAIGVWWWRSGGESDARREAGAAETTADPSSVAPSSVAPSSPSLSDRPAGLPRGAASTMVARPQAVPVDPATAPPLDGPHSPQAAPQQPFTTHEQLAKRADDLVLLDDTEKRLEGELAAAQQAGDTQTARTIEIRLERLRALRDRRRAELERMREGK